MGGALMSVATAALYGLVGESIRKRRAPGDAQLALRLFAVWWFALAAMTALGALREIVALAGVTSLAAHVTLVQISLLPLTAALWALLYYLLYLYTGSRRILWPLSAAYVAIYVALVAMLVSLDPVGTRVADGRVTIAYARALGGPAKAAVLALLVGPVIVAAVLYGSLYFRLEDRGQRYRVGLVSSAFLAWFASPIVGFLLQVSAAPWWPLVSRAFGLLVPVVVLAAYHPPAWVRARLERPASPARAAGP